MLIFFEKDEVILDVFRGRRKEKHAKDTLTDSEHPFEAVQKKTSSVNTEPVKIGFAYYLVAALVISLSLAALPNLFLR